MNLRPRLPPGKERITDDDDDAPDAVKTQAQLELDAKQRDLAKRQAELDHEAEKLNRGDTA